MTKKSFTLLIPCLLLGVFLCLPAGAQEAKNLEADIQPTEVIEVTAQDLGVQGTGWFSRVFRDIKIALTRDPIKKSTLELEKAGVELFRLKTKFENKLSDPEFEEKWQTKSQKYHQLVEKVRLRVETVKEKEPNNQGLEKFTDKYSDLFMKHQELLQNLENKLPEDVMQKVRSKREESLQKFSHTMIRLENREGFAERIKQMLSDSETRSARRAIQYGLAERIKEVDPELKQEIVDKIREFGDQHADELQDIKNRYEQILENRQELREQVKQKLEQLKNSSSTPEQIREQVGETRQEVKPIIKENQNLRQEGQEQIKQIRDEARDAVDGFRNRLGQ